ncbi:HNH endonuclease [Paenibacillus algicola]|uniref:HNH endonuclease n=1 Tax=Paenibacillus algicola TaxID=2565926 RepID=UPI0010FE6890|nr:HNH endonuclease [Paenibacillus algicola]
MPEIFEKEPSDNQAESLLKLLPFESILMKALNNKVDRVITSKSKSYSRNDAVSVVTKLVANGICQLCDQPAPFSDSHGHPFLESHHIVWRSNNGPDILENTAALCPNCHRKMHVLALKGNVDKLKLRATRNYRDLI